MATAEQRSKWHEPFVKALLEVPKMREPDGREQVIDLLPQGIRDRIRKFHDNYSHVLAIVQACDAFPDGIAALIEVVRPFEEGSTAWPAVLASAQPLIAPPADPKPVPPPPPAAEAFALVIGVSSYQYGVPAGQELKAHEFTQLQFAAQDARAMHAFLSRQPGYLVEPLLLDADATCRGLLRALDRLRRSCRPAAGRDPTVLVYFSGHGARDGDGRSYLVPHDARRDELFSTALWSRTFDAALGEIATRRLVVMLDACHAGSIGMPGVKDAEIGGFDPDAVAGANGVERGRYVVASCRPGQPSFEADGHGLFTRELLELLSGRPFQTEQIELYQLYARLKECVLEATRGSQDPYANFARDTSIVVAINEPLRRQRMQRRAEYLAAIAGRLEQGSYERNVVLVLRLTNYVHKGERFDHLAKLYRLFEGWWPRRHLADVAALEQDCRDLIQTFEEADGPPVPPMRVTQVDTAPTLAATAEPAADSLVVAAPAPAGTLAVGLQDERRVFADADIDVVLAQLEADLQFVGIASQLRAKMQAAQGVRVADLSRCLAAFDVPADAADAWAKVRDDLVQRFRAAWTHARVVRSNALGLRAGNSP